MNESPYDDRRPLDVRAVRDLLAAARAERTTLAADAPEHDFYLGVQAAAERMLHPELASTRDDDWLDRESGMFRDGYLKTANALATSQSGRGRPLALPAPG